MKRQTGLKIHDLLFVGVNSNVAALDRHSGRLIWKYEIPQGRGFVALQLYGKYLYASVDGYTYCLRAASGKFVWFNELKGFGVGIPCLASAAGTTMLQSAAAEFERQRKANDDSMTPASSTAS